MFYRDKRLIESLTQMKQAIVFGQTFVFPLLQKRTKTFLHREIFWLILRPLFGFYYHFKSTWLYCFRKSIINVWGQNMSSLLVFHSYRERTLWQTIDYAMLTFIIETTFIVQILYILRYSSIFRAKLNDSWQAINYTMLASL